MGTQVHFVELCFIPVSLLMAFLLECKIYKDILPTSTRHRLQWFMTFSSPEPSSGNITVVKDTLPPLNGFRYLRRRWLTFIPVWCRRPAENRMCCLPHRQDSSCPYGGDTDVDPQWLRWHASQSRWPSIRVQKMCGNLPLEKGEITVVPSCGNIM